MSKQSFSQRNKMLVFAGSTLLVALVVTTGFSMFMPSSDREEPEVVVTEAESVASKPAPPAPAAGWADDSAVEDPSDDWGSGATTSPTPGTAWNGSGRSNGPPDVNFDDYAPDSGPRSSARSGSRSGRGSSSGNGNPSVSSGAAPGAPDLSPPGDGGGESGELQVIG